MAEVTVTRLVTHAELVERDSTRRRLSVSARLAAELSDGRRVVLLDDRGWSASLSGAGDVGAYTTVEDVAEVARTVVGPDEPIAERGETQAGMAADHWGFLAERLARHGVTVDGPALERAPHDVVLSARLRARLA